MIPSEYGATGMIDHQTKKDIEEPISWHNFLHRLRVYGGDLKIVGHPDDTTVALFQKPKEFGHYSLTQPDGMTEEEFVKQIAKVKKVVVSCMDRRVARPLYEQEKGDLQEEEILFLGMAGGPVQNEGRRQDAQDDIAKYLSQFTNIEEVVVAGHDHICGAVAHFIGQPLPLVLEEEHPGGAKEQEFMERLIVFGALIWQKYFANVKAKLAIVDKAHAPTVSLKDIDRNEIKPTTVEMIKHLIRG